MKKKIVSAILATAICLSLTACGKSNTESIVENLSYANALDNNEFSTTVSIKKEDSTLNFKLSGTENQKGLSTKADYSEGDSDYKELTKIYVVRDGLYVETGEGDLQEVLSSFFDTDIELPEELTLFFEPYNEYIDIQNINPKIVRKYINQGLAEELKKQEKDFIKKDKNVFYFTIDGEPLKNALLNVTNYVKANAENIFNDYYNLVDENTKKEMNSSKENTKKQIEAFASFAIKYIDSIDFSSTMLTYKNTKDKNGFQELLKLENTDGNIIDIHNIVKETGAFDIIIPEDITPISEIDFSGDDRHSEKSNAQIEEFYENKYPESSRIKNIIKSLGYINPQLSTTISDVSIYATRESRSLDMTHNIPDEVSVVVENDWLSTITITNSFSLNDYRLYGNTLIQQTAKEISDVIGTEFLVETSTEFGNFENITESWEFFAEIIKVDIKDSNGLITVKLTANQH